MPTTVILAAGLLVVIGGILVLRLHAFIALILAALLVAAMTDSDAVVRSQLLSNRIKLHSVVPDQTPENAPGRTIGYVMCDVTVDESLEYAVLPESGESIGFAAHPVTLVRIEAADKNLCAMLSNASTDDESRGASTAEMAEYLSSHTSMMIVRASDLESAQKLAAKSPIMRVTESLGAGAGKLAILIVAASIIGYCLLHSGAADQIVRSFLAAMGEKASPVAFAVSGFVLGIPVFFDTVFLLMIPLAKSLYQRTGRNYLLSVLAIVVGGTMAHSLVPPTPGPLLIAEQFDVSITSMIFGGIIVGLFAAGCGLLFAYWANRQCQLVPPEFQNTPPNADNSVGKDPDLLGDDDTAPTIGAPPLWEALLPVALPVILMASGTCIDNKGLWQLGPFSLPGSPGSLMRVVCERNMALIIGAALSMYSLIRFRHPTRNELSLGMQTAVTSAGTIILVTAAGGAFGKMMEQTAVAELLQQIPATSPVAIVVAAFLVTTAVRTAQGSATVAMMTAAGVFGGLVTSGAAGVAPLYVALAVGCGSKPFAWMNDSGFLVITRMSGMNENQGLRFVTSVMAIAGFAGLLAVIVGVVFLPNLPR